MKTKTIEELLNWAFVDELPKGGGVEGLDNVNSAWRMLQASSWGKVTAFAELLTLVDIDRGGGGNYLIEQGEPHEDALAIGQAVADLALCDIVIPAGWNGLADWPDDDGLVMPAVERAVEMFSLRPMLRQRAHLVSLVAGTAALGRLPDWQAEPSKVRMVERAGRPAWFFIHQMTDSLGQVFAIEGDGYNPRTGRPVRGAHRKYEFSTDPTGDILGRIDWQLWVAALRLLERRVAPRLVAHRLSPWDASMTPWLARDAGGVILVEGAGQGEKHCRGRC